MHFYKKKNTFKPKLKICHTNSNRIWFNKNFKFINFYNYRRKIMLKRNIFYKRYFLKSRNIKWTFTRRFMYWNSRRKINFIAKRYKNRRKHNFYKNFLSSKQQLKKFYGKVKEKNFIKLFIKNWYARKKWRQNNFFFSLERRLDVILYRLRVLPTIYTCNQYITFNGLLVNNILCKRPHFNANVGDIISFIWEHWYFFFSTYLAKLYYRKLGFFVNKRRNLKKFKLKFLKSLMSTKKGKYKLLIPDNIFLHKRFNALKRRIVFLENKKKKKKISIFVKHNILYKKRNIILKGKWSKKKLLKNKFLKTKIYNNLVCNNYKKMNNLSYFPSYYKIKLRKTGFKAVLERIEKLRNKKQEEIRKKLRIKRLKEMFILKMNNKTKKEKVVIRNKPLLKKNLKKQQLNFEDVEIKKIYSFLKKKKNNNNILLYKYLKELYFLKFKQKKIKRDESFFYFSKEGHLFNHFFYIPSYFEMDNYTLRFGIVKLPKADDIKYSFKSSLDTLITFYKDRGF